MTHRSSRARRLLTAGVVSAALVVPLGTVTSAEAAPKRPGQVSKVAAGLTTDGTRLVRFPLARPGKARVAGVVTGLTGDTRLVGIDYRIQDKNLYGVGDQGGVYVLNRRAQAFKVSQLTVALEGSSFGVDFNPAADRLRVISDTGQNLRHDVNPGGATIADGRLAYPPSAPSATGVTGAAYTNNDLNTDTGTALLDIDSNQDQLVVQSPANAGALALVGKLRNDFVGDVGFDIDQANRGWAVASAPGKKRLFSVNLGTGRTKARGAFPRNLQVGDIAVPLR